MKKYLLFIIGLLLFSLVGCSANNDNDSNKIINDNLTDVGLTEKETPTETVKPLETVTPTETVTPAEDDNTINVWCSSSEVADIIEKFIETHPDFPYEMNVEPFATIDLDFELTLYDSLVAGESVIYDYELPDIYSVEIEYAARFTQGDAYQYSADYKELGIDVDALIEEAEIPRYYIDLGTNPEGNLLALGYQNTSGAFIYRRSIARDVWGSDEPSVIKDVIGPGWDRFFEAAQDLKENGYGICSGINDIWYPVRNSADLGWIVDGKLYIDPKREAFLDYAYKLVDCDYTNNSTQWGDEWFLDIKGEGEKEIFGFLGPYWLVNYVMLPFSGGEAIGEGTYGDWAICIPPSDFFLGGRLLMARKDAKHKEAIGEIFEWITLDTSDTGFQHLFATEEESPGIKHIPASTNSIRNLNYTMDFIGGQDMYEIYISAGKNTRGDNLTKNNELIDHFWLSQVHEYAGKSKTREQAITDFKKLVAEHTDVIVE